MMTKAAGDPSRLLLELKKKACIEGPSDVTTCKNMFSQARSSRLLNVSRLQLNYDKHWN